LGLKRRLFVLLASASLVGALFPAAASAAGPGPIPTSYPPNQTLRTSGTMYGPPTDFNPLNTGDYVTGTFGLLYESLYLYNPLTDKFIPWLAQSGSWTGATTYTLKLRSGLTWNDGTPLTAADVVYTFNLGKLNSVPYSTLWNFLQSVTAVDNLTVQFTFSKALYQEWSNALYTVAILPAKVWGTQTATTVLTYNSSPNAAAGVVGSGPYQLLTYDQTKVVWVKNPNWWGKTLLGLDVKPTYIVDEVNGSNNVELGQMLNGQIDLSNNFLPGVNSIVSGIGGYGIQTYYAKAPYMLSANTAWLVTNDTKKPTNDPVFRRALAESINVSQIVNNVYGQIVQAANPTGLLPTWNQFVDKSVVAKYGTKYNPTDAKKILTAAGYKMGSDGYFRNKDGSPINLELIVPSGWTDWMASIQSIAQSAKAGGIRIHTAFPSYNDRTNKLQTGKFDLAIANDAQIANTPWAYYNWMFRQPIQSVQNAGNDGRYKNSTIWSLVQQLDATSTSNVAGMKKIISQIQTIQLQDLPIIPLWYNGAWSQANNAVWTNWPSSAAGSPHYLPVTWRGYWNMGAVLMLTTLKLAQ
jgi:peptide/nickel transport system substrate-binding protein